MTSFRDIFWTDLAWCFYLFPLAYSPSFRTACVVAEFSRKKTAKLHESDVRHFSFSSSSFIARTLVACSISLLSSSPSPSPLQQRWWKKSLTLWEVLGVFYHMIWFIKNKKIGSVSLFAILLRREGFEYIQKLALQQPILDSIVVSIPACHAGDRGSIPRRGGDIFL